MLQPILLFSRANTIADISNAPQSAYEISTYWGEQPPPKEILEDLSAKGGDLRTRTLANYSVGNSRLSTDAAMAEGVGNSQEEEQVTPKKEEKEPEEPGSVSRYPTRRSSATQNI